MNQFKYVGRYIGSIEALSKSLHIPVRTLLMVEDKAVEFYFPNDPIEEPSGRIRQTYGVSEPLYRIQKRIENQLLDKVIFPEYIQGSVKDPKLPRDYIADAKLHLGRKFIVKEDISRFFEFTSANIVNEVWGKFFHFPNVVADFLTNLTTYNGFLPMGASTSPALANLVFWQFEPELESYLRLRGYCYSRYVDDITISSNERINKRESSAIISHVYGMFAKVGLRPNRKKHQLQTRKIGLNIHNLNLTSGTLTMPQRKRDNIKAAIHELELIDISDISSDLNEEKFASTFGRIKTMEKFHQYEARQLLARLMAIKEHTQDSE